MMIAVEDVNNVGGEMLMLIEYSFNPKSMAQLYLFIGMVALAAILLFAASFLATSGATNSINSTFYNTSSQIRSAHQYLIAAGVIGWITLVFLVVTAGAVIFFGGVRTSPLTEQLNKKGGIGVAKESDIVAAREILSRGNIADVVALNIFILIVVVTFIVGALGVAGSIQLTSANVHDDASQAAYGQAVWTSILGFATMVVMLVVIFSFVSIQSERARELGAIAILEREI